jgi:hypothetical protein
MGVEPRKAQWVVFPPADGRFFGYYTKDDPSRIPELTAPMGQNTTPNEGDRISIRPYGFELFPTTATFSTSTTPTTTLWTFHKRDGSQILVAAQGSNLVWFDEVTQTYANLNSGYTSADFGFAEMNISTDLHSYLYFGNGVQDFSRWTGEHTNLNGALVGGEVTINVDSTTGFPASGTLRIGTTDVTYSGATATSFTGAVGTPAAADNLPISQAVQTYSGNPKGNIYIAFDNRLFVAGITASPQAVYFSRYADATDYTSATVITAATADDPGIFNLVEGGGPVTAMVCDEQFLYMFKENIIYSATLSDSLYSLAPLKPFDGRSQTTGAKSKRSVFVGGNSVFFVSKDNQIYSLQRVEQLDYPQMVPISENIQPTVDGLDFSSLSGIVYGRLAYFSCRASADSDNNDVVLVYNIHHGTWDTPVINFGASDWTVYKIDGVERLLFGDAFSSNIWKVTDTPVDYEYSTTASWRTKQYDFGQESTLKQLDAVFLEGYIDGNTELTVNLYLDDNGFTDLTSTVITGTETDFLFSTTTLNAFGLTPFGTEVFGSNVDSSGRKKFRIFLNRNLRRVPFFTAQLEFLSSGVNQQWEIIRYGFLVSPHEQPIPTKLCRNW